MRVLNCIYLEHDLWLVALAALMCLIGAVVTTRLIRRTLLESGPARVHWSFLSAVTAGAAIWATHFIAMIGYDPGVPVIFEGTLAVASALIAIVGLSAGTLMATSRNRLFAAVGGGGAIGLAMTAMHYVAMFPYRPDGAVQWTPEYIVGSVAAAVILPALAVNRMHAKLDRPQYAATGLLVAAIVLLHFMGMAAFMVTPLPGAAFAVDGEAVGTLAGAIALVALLIVGTGISTQLVDAHSRVRSEDQLRHLALHDALTGLANRRQFNEALQSECLGLDRGGAPFALLLVDLDRFKPINDTLGHPMGDKVLQKVAHRLSRAVREPDLVARIGGDEFAVIARDMADPDSAALLASRIVDLLGRPFVIDSQVAEIGASVGLALAPADGSDAESLTIHADVALYTAKREGRGRACRFDPQLTAAINQRRLLESDLQRACMREDFYVVYQPVRDTVTGTYTGAEALVRWDCPKRGSVPPSDFIPLAEELGLISRIGTAVLQQACRDAAGWDNDYVVAVNLSPVQLLDARLPQIVAQALRESGLPSARLELEITETALLGNDELALRSLLQLRKLGVRIALDDFGTGYSSLSYLHRFPITRIKIDKSFVQRLPSDESSLSIVRAIAQLGLSLDLQITAEEIETTEQLRTISESGCDHVQGFLISRPVRSAEIADLFQLASNVEAA